MKFWWNSKVQMVTKLKNLNCDKTQILTKLKMGRRKKLKNLPCNKTQIVTKLENSNYDKTQILKLWQNSKLKLWQNLIYVFTSNNEEEKNFKALTKGQSSP